MACFYVMFPVNRAKQANRTDYDPGRDWLHQTTHVAGKTLMHLPSGEMRTLAPDARVAAFAPNGDIIAVLADESLVRYCRQGPATMP